MRDIFAIDVNAQSFPLYKLKNIFQCTGEQFRRNNISLSHAPLQLDRFCAIDPTGSYVSWPAVTRFLFRYQEISAASYQVASVERNQELRELEEFYDALYAEYGDF
ncbi:unnamed protein product [Plutella xylostella]|uniref:(diamondback moth) hypothetical protein n=1 Tax=Plutella xylostella TaxID=51655 RepID=A0A8S4FKX7_PLUXY|nr:unnamed protein product [Plutella xylostella]